MTFGQASLAAAIASTLLTAGCASNQPPELSAAPDEAAMQRDDMLGRAALVYRAPNFDPHRYTMYILDPVQIYAGADADWGSSTEQDRQQMAQFMQAAFTKVLQQHHELAQAPGPGVARLNLVLAGLHGNVPVVGTVTHLVPVGLALNLVRSATDQPGTFMGSVTIAGTLVDSRTNAVEYSGIQTRSPNAMNIPATLTSHDAWEAAIDQVADAFGTRLQEQQNNVS